MASPQAPATTQTRWKLPFHTLLTIALAAALAGIAAVTVGFSSFTGFAEYDDEGYVMVGLRSFLQGHALYDFVYSQYGPFYYLVEAGVYAALQQPVTHNAVRETVALLWLLSAGLCSCATYRLTRSWILAALGFTAAIKLLVFLAGSPGHPEEICLVLVLAILLCACYLSERATPGLCVLLGSLLGALTLTKINIGAYASLAIALAFLKATPNGRLQKVLLALAATAGVLFPGVVMAPLLHFPWAQQTVLFLMLSMMAAFLVAWSAETERFVTPALWIPGVAGLGGLAAAVIAVFLVKGTTLSAMLYYTVLQHKDFARNWYIEFAAGPEAIPALSLMAAFAWVTVSAAKPKARGPAIVTLTILKVALSVLWCWNLRAEHPATIYNTTIPWAWLVLVPSTGDAPKKQPFARVVLCLLSVFTAMYLLPVAGTQVSFSVVLTIPIVCVWLDDARYLLAGMPGWGTVLRAAEVLVVILVLATSLFWAHGAVVRYRRLTPLRLAGAEWIHVPARQADTYRRIKNTLNKSCDSNFSMPGIFSFYFWTKGPPPTRLLMSNWFGLLNAMEQQQIVTDLSRIDNLCIVYNPKLVELWRRGQDLSVSPLARYIQDGFAPLEKQSAYVILIRRPPSSPAR